MKIEPSLTKESFWNAMKDRFPKSMQIFCEWIDEYKAAVNWENLFGTHETKFNGATVCVGISPKFHHIPKAMQQGIWLEFIRQNLGDYFEQVERHMSELYDFENDIEVVFGEMEPLITTNNH